MVSIHTFSGYEDFDENEIYAILQSILEDRNWNPAYFAGGTLCYDYKCRVCSPNRNADAKVLLFNFSDNLPSRLKTILAQIYLKHKGEKGSHREEAEKLVKMGASTSVIPGTSHD